MAADLPRILASFDQPTGDGINTWYASQTARQGGVTVALSGLGGDELFEALTLVQTHKVTRFPVVLFGVSYWSGLFEWVRNTLVAEGKASPADLELIQITDSVDEAMKILDEARLRNGVVTPAHNPE